MNTIHIIMDTLKASWLGAYGNEWVKTPNIDRFAERSTVFTQAYCSSFPCMPARRDFLTGRYEFPFRGWGPLEESDVTLPSMIKETGRVTGLVTDHHHLFKAGSGNYHCDYDGWHFIRGLCDDHYYTDRADTLNINYRCNPDRIAKRVRDYYFKYRHFDMKSEEDWPAARTFSQASDWIRRNYDQPDGFHLQIDSFPPHEPFDPPPGYSEAYDPDYDGERIVFPAYQPATANYTAKEQSNIRALYAGTITYVDRWFGQFMDQVEKLGCLDNTVIILSSDHGTYTGDHGWTGKLGRYMYDCITHVPLIVYHPEAGAGRCDSLVSNVDIVPTILDLCGVEPQHELHGKSLLPLLHNHDESTRAYAHSGFFGISHVINDGRYAFHMFPDHDKDLYWYGVQASRFVQAGSLGPVEIAKDGQPRRKVEPGWAREYNFEPALFDLQTDPAQERNIAPEHPEIMLQFQSEFVRFCQHEIKAREEYVERYMHNFHQDPSAAR